MNERLTPEEVVKRLAVAAGLSVAQARAFLQAQAELAGQCIRGGYPLAGIGVISREEIPGRQMVMKFGPKAGRTVEVPSRQKLKFTFSPAITQMAFGAKATMPDVFSLDWYRPEDEVAGESPKLIDFRSDRPNIQKYLARRIEAASAGAKPISAIEAGFKLCQAGTIVLNLDVRPKHKRDGRWTHALNGDVLDMPHWRTAYEAADKFGLSFINLDGTAQSLPPRAGDAAIAGVFGEALRSIVIQGLRDGACAKLRLREDCQLDIEEFDGMWAWPAFKEMGRSNLIRTILAKPAKK